MAVELERTMRVALAVLGILGGMMLFEHAYITIRVDQLLAGGALTSFTIGPVVMFAFWGLATGLAWRFPAIAGWTFAAGGVAGLYTGIAHYREAIVAWGAVALLLALVATLARREQRAEDRRDREQDQRLAAARTELVALVRAKERPRHDRLEVLTDPPRHNESAPSPGSRPPAPVTFR